MTTTIGWSAAEGCAGDRLNDDASEYAVHRGTAPVAILCWPGSAYQDHSGDELDAWVAAVRSHTAGQEDVFTEDIQRWPAAKWDRMALSIRDFVSLLRDPAPSRRRIGSWSEAETGVKRQLALDISAGVGPNDFLRRAAICMPMWPLKASRTRSSTALQTPVLDGSSDPFSARFSGV